MGKEVKYEEKVHDQNTIPSTKSEKNVNVKDLLSRLNQKRKKEKMISYGLLIITVAALCIIGVFVSL